MIAVEFFPKIANVFEKCYARGKFGIVEVKAVANQIGIANGIGLYVLCGTNYYYVYQVRHTLFHPSWMPMDYGALAITATCSNGVVRNEFP